MHECAWKFQNGTGKANWSEYETHIQNHGNLGSQYPKYVWGLGPDNNAYSYVNYTGTASSVCRNYEAHFYPATFNNFAARMDWAKDGSGNRNPIVVINENTGIDIITKTPQPGATLILDASATSDPDGDSLTFKWWILSEAGTYTQDIIISNSNSSRVTVKIPSDSEGKTFHVICEVTDNGTHNLSSYRRLIFEP